MLRRNFQAVNNQKCKKDRESDHICESFGTVATWGDKQKGWGTRFFLFLWPVHSRGEQTELMAFWKIPCPKSQDIWISRLVLQTNSNSDSNFEVHVSKTDENSNLQAPACQLSALPLYQRGWLEWNGKMSYKSLFHLPTKIRLQFLVF